MEYKVSENFITLALNPKSGNFLILGNYLRYGIIGSIMMDLAAGGRITVSNRRIKVCEGGGITGIVTHDRMMEKFLKSSRPIRISLWFRRLSINSNWYRRELMNMLINNGRLKRERKRFLIFPYNLTYVSDIGRYKKLIERFRDIILYGKEPDDTELMTLGLIYACKMHKVLASESTSRQNIRRALKRLIKESPVTSEISQTIRELQAAITSGIAASVAATSS